MSSTSSESIAKQIVTLQSFYLLYHYFVLSSYVLWFQDFLLTLPTEVQSIWSSRLTGASVLFILGRYSFLLSAAMELVVFFPEEMSDISCRGLYFTAYFFASISAVATKLLSILRVYALFGQKRSLLILLCPFVIADIVDAFLAWFSTTVTASQGTYAEPFSSCFWGGNSSELEISEVLLLLLRLTFESIIFILTLIRTVHHLMQTRKYGINSIAEVVLRNGILYFFTIFITTSIPATFVLSDTVFSGGMILNKAEGVTFMFNASSLNVFANLLINRFVLNLRAFSHRTVQSSSKGSSNTNTPTLSALSFAESRFIGNMGAPLDFHQWDEVEDPETEVEREEGHIE